MLLHINPTRSEGNAPDPSLALRVWYMTFFAAGVIMPSLRSRSGLVKTLLNLT